MGIGGGIDGVIGGREIVAIATGLPGSIPQNCLPKEIQSIREF